MEAPADNNINTRDSCSSSINTSYPEEKSVVETGGSTSGPQPPDMFLCPISREVMRDPVVLVETGQMYDRSSISEWFKTGHSTCPLTGRCGSTWE